jgi:hypothetical protein
MISLDRLRLDPRDAKAFVNAQQGEWTVISHGWLPFNPPSLDTCPAQVKKR